jgi:tetratricopeptide (TPR) repeat protein
LVQVLDEQGRSLALGSGVAVGPEMVVTNKHIVEKGTLFKLRQGETTWLATVAHCDPEHDLCELKGEGLKAAHLAVRPSSSLAVGERVFAIGAPEGLELTLSEGLISGLRDFEDARIIQTTAPISHGSSGGGLFDEQGQLIGITTFFVKEGQNLNFALPGEWVLALDARKTSEGLSASAESRAFQALTWAQLAAQAATARKFDEALNATKEVVRLVPEFAASWFYLGLSYRLCEKHEEAVSAFRQAVRLKPDYGDAWYNLGLALSTLQRFQDGIAAYEKTISLKPDDADAWSALGVAYGALQKYGDAVRAEKEAIRLNPGHAGAWYNLGSAYLNVYQYQEALSAFREAIRLQPNHYLSWNNLGWTYNLLREYGQARGALQEAIRLKPDYASAWYNLGMVHSAEGNRSSVLEVYKKLRSLDPELANRFFREVVLP